MLISISANDAKSGRVKPKRTGSAGRPKKVFVPDDNCDKPTEVNAHLHIFLYACPGETIKDLIQTYFIERGISVRIDKLTKAPKDDKYIDIINNKNEKNLIKSIRYCLKQGVSIRKLVIDPDCKLSPDYYNIGNAISEAAKINCHGNIFDTFFAEKVPFPQVVSNSRVSLNTPMQ